MSRCFPFPPPGYEKKSRTDDVDLLKKEKHREKKHKKEKKDNENREGKEKREKDRSDGKHREKKDRKEKHRDKKKDREKDRDKDKDKDKNSASDEKRFAGQSQGHNGEALSQKEDRDKDKKSVSDERRFSGQFVGYDGEKLGQYSHISEETKDSKFVQELGRRIRDENRGSGNQLAEKYTGRDRKKDEGAVRLVAKDSGTGAEKKEKNKDKRVDDKKMDEQGIRDGAKSSGNSIVQNLAGTKVEGMPRSMEKNIEKKMEGKEKTKEKEGDDKRGDKRKDKDREKKSSGKDKDRNKEKKKEEKAKEKSEQKNTEQDKIKASNKNDPIGTHNIKTSDLPRDSNKSGASGASGGNLKKRKDPETNGFLHANDVRPNKLPRPTSSHPLTENGRILEPCQTPIILTSAGQGAARNLKVDNKERRINGVIEAPPIPILSTKPSSETAQADQIAEASTKLPHPDSKYLSQILSVPKMEESSDFDDQEWLFSSDETQSRKPKVGSSIADETPQVWAEALRIDLADVCALPYVIPY